MNVIYKLLNRSEQYKRQGFTLIELITVMSIIGIMALFIVPRFSGQIKKTEVTQIRNDIMIAETKVKEWLFLEDARTDNWTFSLNSNEDKKLYTKDGALVGNITRLENITDSINKEINTQLKGEFYAKEDGAVYYYNGTADFEVAETVDTIRISP